MPLSSKLRFVTPSTKIDGLWPTAALSRQTRSLRSSSFVMPLSSKLRFAHPINQIDSLGGNAALSPTPADFTEF